MSDFDKRTVKISPEELEARQRLRFQDSAGVAGSGGESTPEATSSFLESTGDVLKSGVQSASLETLDDLIETLSPEMAEKYRGVIQESRERTPFGTLMGDIVSPNPLGKLKAGGKVLSKIAPELGTSVVQQLGTDGEVSPMQTVLETGAGKALTGITKKLAIGDRLKRRATSLGANKASAIKRYVGKSGKEFEDEFIKGEISALEKAGLFEPGVVKYDTAKDTFISKATKGQKVKGSVLPPSNKEIAKRLDSMKNSLGSKIDEVVGKNQYTFHTDVTDEVFNDLQAEIAGEVYANPKTANSVYEEVMDRLFDGKDSIDLTDIHAVKKDLYSIIGDRNFQKAMSDNPDKAVAYRKAARWLNDIVGESIDDPKFREMNKRYGTASDMYSNVRAKIRGEFADTGVSSSVAIGSPLYRAARVMEESRDALMGLSAQGSQSLQKIPMSGEYLRGVGAGAIPRLMRPDGQGRSPDSVNLPLNIVKTKLPRTVEGILENKEVLLAKVGQQMPDYFDQVKFIVEERPEDIEQMMPMIMKLVPQAFESDKYGRINNMILDPIMQQKARGDIMEDSRLSNSQKINMIDKLNRTNVLEDY